MTELREWFHRELREVLPACRVLYWTRPTLRANSGGARLSPSRVVRVASYREGRVVMGANPARPDHRPRPLAVVR
jgi:hypothetical protein